MTLSQIMSIFKSSSNNVSLTQFIYQQFHKFLSKSVLLICYHKDKSWFKHYHHQDDTQKLDSKQYHNRNNNLVWIMRLLIQLYKNEIQN